MTEALMGVTGRFSRKRDPLPDYYIKMQHGNFVANSIYSLRRNANGLSACYCK